LYIKIFISTQKYHSIQRSGKRLEDVLGEEELKQLQQYILHSFFLDVSDSRREHGDLMEVEETADLNNHVDHEDAKLPQQQINGGSGTHEREAYTEVRFDIFATSRSVLENHSPAVGTGNFWAPRTHKNVGNRRGA
jgi:hypothetical protein